MAANKEEARRQANLRLLQRSDPAISNILGSATHVVLYDYSAVSSTWEKQNVEGSMFLCTKGPGYLLTILNRSSPENHVIQLTADFQLQNQDPYLIFRQAGPAGTTMIRGIWFPNPNERTSMNDLLTRTLEAVRNAPPAPPAPVAAAPMMDHGAATAALLQTLNIGGAGTAAAAASSNNSSKPGSYAAAATTSTAPRTPAAQQQPPARSTPPRQPSPSSGHAPTLDKKSLQLALLSLIQDDRFLDLLHAQYMKVTHARASQHK
jgi:mRNA-decapping enzyme 1B